MTEHGPEDGNELTGPPPEFTGEMWEKGLLNPDLQKDPGLITFITADGYALCPAIQFIEDEEGYSVLRPELSAAWAASRALDEQLGESEIVTWSRYNTPRSRLEGRTWLEVLTAESPDRSVLGIVKRDIVEDARQRNSWVRDEDKSIRDPRTTLPQM